MSRVQIVGIVSSAVAACCLMTYLFYKKKKKHVKRPMMRLYVYDNFRSKRCEWLLAELGGLGDVERVDLNPQDPNLEILAQYRKLHPHCTIPCLEVEGRQPIIESGAICLYLADVYENLGPGKEKEAYYSWIVYCVATVDELMENLFHQWYFTELEQQNNDLINKMVLKFEVFAKYLTKMLHDREYICGNRFTAADCILGYNLWWANAMREGVLLQNWPVIRQYYERLSRRCAFQRVMLENES